MAEDVWAQCMMTRVSSRVVAGYMCVLVCCQRSLIKPRPCVQLSSLHAQFRGRSVLSRLHSADFTRQHHGSSSARPSVLRVHRCLPLLLHATTSTRRGSSITTAPSTRKMDWPASAARPGRAYQLRLALLLSTTDHSHPALIEALHDYMLYSCSITAAK